MNIEQLKKELTEDLAINASKLDYDSIQTPYLISKWLGYIFDEQMNFKKVHNTLASKKVAVFEHHTFERNGRVDRRDILETYIPGDVEIQYIENKLEIIEQKINMMERAVKSLEQRSFIIKNAIEWKQFMKGTI